MNFYTEENDSVSDVNCEPICLHTNVVVTRLLGMATKACPRLCRGFGVRGYREADRTPPTPEAQGVVLEGIGLGTTCGSQVTAVVFLQVLIWGHEADVTKGGSRLLWQGDPPRLGVRPSYSHGNTALISPTELLIIW